MRTIFSKEEVVEFSKHPCVFHVSERSIHYTYEFKKRAMELHAEGAQRSSVVRPALRKTSLRIPPHICRTGWSSCKTTRR